MMGVPNFGSTKEIAMRMNPTPAALRARRIARRVAFTLVEMMIVVAIIVLLAGVGTYYMAGAIDEGNKAKAKADIKSITDASIVYKTAHNGQWPQSIDDLINQDADGNGPWLKSQEARMSPWGTQYVLDPSCQMNKNLQPDVYCQIPGGGRVVNWQSKIEK
jgi:general secretion pathway protein G